MLVLLFATIGFAHAQDEIADDDCPPGTELQGVAGVEQWCARGSEREGPYIAWQAGRVRARGGYAGGLRTGAWIWFDPTDGSVQSKGTYQDDQPDGLWVFVPGQGRWEARYDQGEQVSWTGGAVELAVVDGGIQRRDATDPAVILIGGIVRPTWLSVWNPEHFSTRAAVFGAVTPTGPQTALDALHGTKRWEGAFDEAGRPDGPWTRWHATGVKAFVGRFVSGSPSGDWQTWHANGQLRSQGRFDASGRRVGPWQFWHDNGQLMAQGAYQEDPTDCPIGCEGVRAGTWRFHHRSGMKQAEADFDGGELQLFDERGQPRPGDQAPEVPAFAAVLGVLPSP